MRQASLLDGPEVDEGDVEGDAGAEGPPLVTTHGRHFRPALQELFHDELQIERAVNGEEEFLKVGFESLIAALRAGKPFLELDLDAGMQELHQNLPATQRQRVVVAPHGFQGIQRHGPVLTKSDPGFRKMWRRNRSIPKTKEESPSSESPQPWGFRTVYSPDGSRRPGISDYRPNGFRFRDPLRHDDRS